MENPYKNIHDTCHYVSSFKRHLIVIRIELTEFTQTCKMH